MTKLAEIFNKTSNNIFKKISVSTLAIPIWAVSTLTVWAIALTSAHCSYAPLLKPALKIDDLLFYHQSLQSQNFQPQESSDFSAHRRFYFLAQSFERMKIQRCDFAHRLQGNQACQKLLKNTNIFDSKVQLDQARPLNALTSTSLFYDNDTFLLEYMIPVRRIEGNFTINSQYKASNTLKGLQVVWPSRQKKSDTPNTPNTIDVYLIKYVFEQNDSGSNSRLAYLLEASHQVAHQCKNLKPALWFFYDDNFLLKHFLSTLAKNLFDETIKNPRLIDYRENFQHLTIDFRHNTISAKKDFQEIFNTTVALHSKVNDNKQRSTEIMTSLEKAYSSLHSLSCKTL